MNKYLVVYRNADNRINNAIVSWDAITQYNIDNFECHYDEEDILCIINIIKLDSVY